MILTLASSRLAIVNVAQLYDVADYDDGTAMRLVTDLDDLFTQRVCIRCSTNNGN